MIPVAEPWLTDQELELVTDALERAWISPKGNYVSKFETAMADVCGTEHAFATSSGTSALHLSLVAAGIGPGDEVIVPDLTWIACGNVVEYVGADPVFVDVTEETFTLDADSVKNAVTARTAAIMPVHLYGFPCDMDPLLSLAAKHDFFVVEDCAEAHGAEYRDNPVGSMGDVGCFSFYGNKILTTGQGGMIVTDDDELAERLVLYRRDGMSRSRKYYHEVIGYNYRLTNMQAAVGVAQVGRLEEILTEKRRVANRYRENLATLPLRFQTEPEWATPTYWMNTPVFNSVETRDAVESALDDVEIETRPFFYPLHDQPPYRGSSPTQPTISKTLYEYGLNLPSGPLLTDEQIDEICAVIATVCEK